MKYNKILNVMLLGAMCLGFVACEKEEQEPSKPIYTVTLSVNDETMGTVAGDGTYENGETATLTATGNEGYAFYAWSDGSTENPRTVTSETTLEATFYAFYNGHHYVDLGLPSGLLWAVCNVGAKKMEEYGDYIAWGETDNHCNVDDYKWGVSYNDGTGNFGMTKYNNTDGKTVLEAEDDAASVIWGGAWRIPTRTEQDELRTNCTWTWTDNYNGTGTKGFIVASKAEGNSNYIFLPAAGFRRNSSLSNDGANGCYWTSSLYTSSVGYAYSFTFSSTYIDCGYQPRSDGNSVRAVFSIE